MESDSSDSTKDSSSVQKLVKKFKDSYRKTRELFRNKDSLDFLNNINLESSKLDMIKGIISLSAKNAREIMIPRIDIIALESNTNLKDIVKTVCQAGHSRIPVFEKTIDNITGILYVKDLLKFVSEKPKKFQLTGVLHKPYFVPETIQLDDLLLEFKKRKLHLAIVVDEYGGVGGIVTLEDILEEIVGEIDDEFDDYKLPEIQKINGSAIEVDSRVTLSEINNEANLNLPAEEFDTIGGLVFDLFGKIPKKNESVKYKNIIFRIKDISGTRIKRIVLNISDKKKKSR